MIAPGTGYVRLQDFSETTERELGEALDQAQGRRACSGWCSTCATTPAARSTRRSPSSNRFLKKGQMIVYTRGRIPNSDEDYRAVDRGRLQRRAADRDGQPPERERVGDRQRRDAGSRPRA